MQPLRITGRLPRPSFRSFHLENLLLRHQSTKHQLDANTTNVACLVNNKPAYATLAPLRRMFRLPSNLVSRTAKFHEKRPLSFQLCISTLTFACGDILAQKIGGEAYDSKRTWRMTIIGMIAAIPGYKWFLFLNNNFNYASKSISLATKVAVQQAVFTPVFNTYFFGMQAILTGQPPSDVLQRIKDSVPTSMLNSLKLWPAMTAINFTFVPPQHRFMFSNFVAVGWQAYLSSLNRRKELHRATQVAETDEKAGI